MGRLVRFNSVHISFDTRAYLNCFSSQSVARLNNSWSNNPTVGPRAARGGRGSRGGFAGREDLEQTRRYRDADENRDGGYGMVFDVPDGGRGSSKRRKRSRSRSRERERDGDRDRRRRRTRSPPPREKERRRSRSGDRRPKERERHDTYR